MTTIIRQADSWQLIQDSYYKCTCLINKETGKQSNWNNGYDAMEEIIHCTSISDEEFVEYCNDVCK